MRTVIESEQGPWDQFLGQNVFIRTVTMALTGRLVSIADQELVLEDASWIASTGRFSEALHSGEFEEIEPFPTGTVIVGRAAVIDACEWSHALPSTVK